MRRAGDANYVLAQSTASDNFRNVSTFPPHYICFLAVIHTARGSQIDSRFISSAALPAVGDILEFRDHGVATVTGRRMEIIPWGEHSPGIPNPQLVDEIRVECMLMNQ